MRHGWPSPPCKISRRPCGSTDWCAFVEHYAKEYPDAHLKDLIVDALGPNREMDVAGGRVINFGSDSFLGLDQDPRVQAAILRGLRHWGAHNGASRAFASVRSNEIAEEKLASWLGHRGGLDLSIGQPR